ncbi:unnamed protein product [Parnassius apollo]|uniref:(apollo) hypothetical protein n=1 Tax=Parnassius apollo TaxID=110799 RepID=A0A8S3XR58_PARAO|nr:unnamed protein product [Parnassius apollo]
MATKRSNPFIEDFVPQSKVHVGLKQFNNNEDRLKKVYEKTLELLFKGAKKSSNLDSISTQTIAAICKKDGMKQLVIGKDGCLLNSEETQVQAKLTAVQQCSCGNTKTEVNCTYCEYCERVLCIMCQHCCARCEKYHCSQCSLIGSPHLHPPASPEAHCPAGLQRSPNKRESGLPRSEGSQICVSCYG